MGRLGVRKLDVRDSSTVRYVVNNLWLLRHFPGVEIPPGLKVTAGRNGRELDLDTILSECKNDLPFYPGSPHLEMHIAWPLGASLDAKGFNGEWKWKPRGEEACSKAIIQGQSVWWDGGTRRSDVQLVAKKLSLVQGEEQLTGELQGNIRTGRNLSIKWNNGTQWRKGDASAASSSDEQRKAIHASLDEQKNKRLRH